jgi:hypothetical protein
MARESNPASVRFNTCEASVDKLNASGRGGRVYTIVKPRAIDYVTGSPRMTEEIIILGLCRAPSPADTQTLPCDSWIFQQVSKVQSGDDVKRHWRKKFKALRYREFGIDDRHRPPFEGQQSRNRQAGWPCSDDEIFGAKMRQIIFVLGDTFALDKAEAGHEVSVDFP